MQQQRQCLRWGACSKQARGGDTGWPRSRGWLPWALRAAALTTQFIMFKNMQAGGAQDGGRGAEAAGSRGNSGL